MSRRRRTHQAPDWTPTESGWFIVALVALACSLAFAAVRLLEMVAVA